MSVSRLAVLPRPVSASPPRAGRTSASIRAGAGAEQGLTRKLQAMGAALLLTSSAAVAQVAPDAGQLLRESQQQQQPRLAPTPLPDGKTPKASEDTGPRVVVREFRIDGAVRYDEATLQAVVAGYLDRPLGFGGL
jgi:hemolysin activation/secretion protein